MYKDPVTDKVIATDACLTGYGGTMGNQYFRGRFPAQYQNKNIATLEMWAVMAALRLWGQELTGKYFWIHVDNEAVASIINTGRSKDNKLQNTLCEIVLLAARHQFVIKARHMYIAGVDNRVPDWLSRWDNMEARKKFRQFAQDKGMQYKRTNNTILQHEHTW